MIDGPDFDPELRARAQLVDMIEQVLGEEKLEFIPKIEPGFRAGIAGEQHVFPLDNDPTAVRVGRDLDRWGNPGDVWIKVREDIDGEKKWGNYFEVRYKPRGPHVYVWNGPQAKREITNYDECEMRIRLGVTSLERATEFAHSPEGQKRSRLARLLGWMSMSHRRTF